MEKYKELREHLPMLIKFAKIKKVDLHGKSKSEAEKIIDRLAIEGNMVEVITGHGRGILKKLVKDLQKIYGYTILSVAPNFASYVIDFS